MKKITIFLLFITIVLTSCDQNKVSEDPVKPEEPSTPEQPNIPEEPIIRDKFVIADEVKLDIVGPHPDNFTPIESPAGDILFYVATDWLEGGKGVELSIDPDTKNLLLTRTGSVQDRNMLPLFFIDNGEGPRMMKLRVKASKDSIIIPSFTRDNITINTVLKTITQNYQSEGCERLDLCEIEEGVVITIESLEVTIPDRFVIADPVSKTTAYGDRSFTPIKNPDSVVLFYVDNEWFNNDNGSGLNIEIEEQTKNLKMTVKSNSTLGSNIQPLLIGDFEDGNKVLKMRIKSSKDINIHLIQDNSSSPGEPNIVTGNNLYSTFLNSILMKKDGYPFIFIEVVHDGTVINIESFSVENQGIPNVD